jgi:hypothetical protein
MKWNEARERHANLANLLDRPSLSISQADLRPDYGCSL